MNAAGLMNSDFFALRHTATVKDAIDIIMSKRFRRVPVVDADGRFLGVVGIHCLLRLVLPKGVLPGHGLHTADFVDESLEDLHERLRSNLDHPISGCLDDDVVVVEPETPLVATLLTLYTTRASLPVVEPDSGKLVGMISYWDVGERILSTGREKS